MTAKAPGEPAKLTYDTDRDVAPGDVVQTANTGRMYLVERSRLTRRPGRWVLDTVVLPPDHVLDQDDTVHTLVWYRR